MKQRRVKTLRSSENIQKVSDGVLLGSVLGLETEEDRSVMTCWANSTITALALSSNSSLVFFFCFFSVATTSVSGLFFQS